MKGIKSISGLEKFYDEIRPKLESLEKLKNQNYPNICKIKKLDQEIQSIRSRIDAIKHNSSNKKFLGLVLTEESKSKVTELRKKQQLLCSELALLSSNSGLTIEQYNSLLEDIRDYEKLQKKILLKITNIERVKEKKDRLNSALAGYEGRSRNRAKSIKKDLYSYDYCPYCGKEIGDEPHADHIYPVSKGGQSSKENMVYRGGPRRPDNRKARLSSKSVHSSRHMPHDDYLQS